MRGWLPTPLPSDFDCLPYTRGSRFMIIFFSFLSFQNDRKGWGNEYVDPLPASPNSKGWLPPPFVRRGLITYILHTLMITELLVRVTMYDCNSPLISDDVVHKSRPFMYFLYVKRTNCSMLQYCASCQAIPISWCKPGINVEEIYFLLRLKLGLILSFVLIIVAIKAFGMHLS